MRYRLMATYRGVPYEAGIGPTDEDVVLFAACPPPEELGFEPATGHWRKQLRIQDLQALWESRPMGTFRGDRCIVLDDLGDRLHIAYLGHDAYHAEQLGYWEVDRGVFELITPRDEVSEIVEERLDYPQRPAASDELAEVAQVAAPALPAARIPAAAAVAAAVNSVNSGNRNAAPADAAEPYLTGPHTARHQANEIHLTGPHAARPQANEIHLTGPHAARISVTGPYPVLPQADDPSLTGPHAVRPQADEPRLTGPHAVRPQADEPHLTGPHAAQPQAAAPPVATPQAVPVPAAAPAATASPSTGLHAARLDATAPGPAVAAAGQPALPLEAAARRAAAARGPRLADPPVPEPAPEAPRHRRSGLRRLATQRIFAELAGLAAIPPSAYAVGEEVDGAMCLIQTPEGFEVFNAAAGSRHEVRIFDDEESAYFYLFGVLAAEAVRTGRLAPQG